MRRVSEIRETEMRPGKVNHRKLMIDTTRKPRPAARGVEGSAGGETMHIISVMQITTPYLTGAGKDAGFHSTWMGMVRILVVVDDVTSMRPQARGETGGHQVLIRYAPPRLNPGKGSG